MRILIVDDEVDSREMLRVLLRLDGHDVAAAANVGDAWKLFQDNDFSVVISDWLMPEANGLELCRRVRAADTPGYCYIILLTALKGKANYLEAMGAGADDFVTKPYDPDELRARLVAAERIVGLKWRIKRLEGVLPTCTYCKKIRDASNRWTSIERYISDRSDASFSHGVCPDCYENIVKPELDRSRSQ